MNFLQVLNDKFGNFYADPVDLQILNDIEIYTIELCESKQR